MSSLIVKTLGLDITKLTVEGKIIFDEKSGEFYINKSINRGHVSYQQAIQIAKFDFLNLYIPSKWFINKRNLEERHSIPEPNDRIIQPFYSKNRGCQIIPISDVIKSKGTNFDVNQILLRTVSEFEQEYKKLSEKLIVNLSSEFRTPYDSSRKILRWLQNNELQKGEQIIFGKKFYVFNWIVESREYFILLYYSNHYYNSFDLLFFRKLPNGYAFASDTYQQDQFEKDILWNGDSGIIKTLKSIHEAFNYCRNGYRLSKFLIKCALEGFDIVTSTIQSKLDYKRHFKIFYKETQLALIKQEQEGEKTFLYIHFSNCLWDNKLNLRGKENNSEEHLKYLKEMKESL